MIDKNSSSLVCCACLWHSILIPFNIQIHSVYLLQWCRPRPFGSIITHSLLNNIYFEKNKNSSVFNFYIRLDQILKPILIIASFQFFITCSHILFCQTYFSLIITHLKLKYPLNSCCANITLI